MKAGTSKHGRTAIYFLVDMYFLLTIRAHLEQVVHVVLAEVAVDDDHGRPVDDPAPLLAEEIVADGAVDGHVAHAQLGLAGLVQEDVVDGGGEVGEAADAGLVQFGIVRWKKWG